LARHSMPWSSMTSASWRHSRAAGSSTSVTAEGWRPPSSAFRIGCCTVCPSSSTAVIASWCTSPAVVGGEAAEASRSRGREQVFGSSWCWGTSRHSSGRDNDTGSVRVRNTAATVLSTGTYSTPAVLRQGQGQGRYLDIRMTKRVVCQSGCCETKHCVPRGSGLRPAPGDALHRRRTALPQKGDLPVSLRTCSSTPGLVPACV
jgi:hypothetical protein